MNPRRFLIFALAISVLGGIAFWATRPAIPYPVTFRDTFDSRSSWSHWSFSKYWRTRGILRETSGGILDRVSSDAPAFGGVAVQAETMGPWGSDRDFAIAQWPIADRPFQFGFQVDLEEVRCQQYFSAGIAVVLCPRPPDQMRTDDLCLVCHIHYAGVAVAAWRGWFLDEGAEQISLTTSGGDDLESVAWHFSHLRDGRLRFMVERTPEDEVRFRIWSDQLPDIQPWFDTVWPIPPDMRSTAFETIVIQRVPVKPRHYGYPGFVLRGRVRMMAGGPWEQRIDNPIEFFEKGNIDTGIAADLAAPVETRGNRLVNANGPNHAAFRRADTLRTLAMPDKLPEGPRLLWTDRTLVDLARRFRSPQMAEYRVRIERESQDGKNLFSTLLVAEINDDADARERLMVPIREICRQREAIDFAVLKWANVALVYDSLKHKLNDNDRQLLEQYLAFALETYALCDDDWFFHPRHNPSNTIAVANAGGGLVALALLDIHPRARQLAMHARQRLSDWVPRAVQPDGGYVEGTLYWNFALNQYLLFLDAWRRVGIDDSFDAIDEPLSRNDQYATAIIGGDHRMLTFNDTQPWMTGLGVMAFWDREFDRPLMRWLVDDAFVSNTADQSPALPFLWRKDADFGGGFPGIPTVSWLPETGLVTLRSDSAAVPGAVVSMTGCGTKVTHHAQADQGSIIYSVNGRPVLIDPGYYQGSADAHSIPLIGVPLSGDDVQSNDSIQWRGPEPGRVAAIIDAGENEQIRWATIDLSAAYAGDASDEGKNANLPTDFRLFRTHCHTWPAPVGR